MFDYAVLRVIWWGILGILLIGFAVMDGFDLGMAALLPFIARNDLERRVAIGTVEPVWEGNQVWFILGGGAIFAAWPALYAASFSGFYLAMFLVLVTLILRPVSFKFRSKLDDPRWRSVWDWTLFASGIVPSLVFGVAFGNLFLGVPFTFDQDNRFHTTISLLSLLSPFALLVGLVSLCMIVLHGATWLNAKTDGVVQMRARRWIPYLALGFMLLFAVAGFWLSRLDGYQIVGQFAHGGPSNPMAKTAIRPHQSWLVLTSFGVWQWVPVLVAFGGALGAVLLRGRPWRAFLCSAFVVANTIIAAGFALFPFLLPSSANPSASLTVWDASSSRLTLAVMLVAVLIFLPIVVAYTSWVYRVLRGPVRAADIAGTTHSAY